MTADVLVAEIGSTTTVVSAFAGLKSGLPRFLGQGAAATTVSAGDVNIGVESAIADLRKKLNVPLDWEAMYASSSAAGGLRMTVHGLVYDMTVRAAKEAALGSGAVLVGLTAGKLSEDDLDAIAAAKPKMILVAGGVDYGERETALHNVRLLLPHMKSVPLVYAGNIENRAAIGRLAEKAGVQVSFASNVYPSLDTLQVESAREVIQALFEAHIVHAPGLGHIRDLVDGPILPTPGAVMLAAELAAEVYGDTLVFDVGGATTDVHSVTDGSESMRAIQTAPEPRAKRTVEGDLGIFVNRRHVFESMNPERWRRVLPDADERIDALPAIPETKDDIALAALLAAHCLETALHRHAGRLVERFTPSGRLLTAVGKDLTAIKTIIGTGGALSRLPSSGTLLEGLRRPSGGSALYPTPEARILLDRDYIMSSIGVLSTRYRDAAGYLLKQTLEG